MLELYQSVVNFGVLVVISVMYLTQTPKMIEKITRVVEANTDVIRDAGLYHERMENAIEDMKRDIEDLKSTKDNEEIKAILSRLEDKVDQLGKE